MGNSSSLSNPNVYGRNQKCIEYLEKEFWLSKSDLQQFFTIFEKIYHYNENYQYLISINEFLVYFNIESNSIHKLIFGWLNFNSNHSITFSFIEFVTVLCTFLSLNDIEFSKFIFILFDTNRDGILEYDEITELLNIIKSEDNVKNRPIVNILTQLANSDLKSFNMSKFLTLFQKHTALTNPFRQLKCELQIICLGTNFWDAKINERMKPSRSQTKFAVLDNYRVIAREIESILHEMESSDVSLERFRINPKYLEQLLAKERSARATFPSTNGGAGTGTGTAGGSQKIKPQRRELKRGNSNDDMLNSQGKLHSQPSSKKIHPTLQQQRTQRQLNQVGVIMENYQQQAGTIPLPKIRPYESSNHEDDSYSSKTALSNSIPPSSSSEENLSMGSTHHISSSHKAPSSANLLPSVSRKGGSLNSGSPRARNTIHSSTVVPTATSTTPKLTQQLVLPRGTSNRRSIIRRHSSDDLLR